MWAWRSRELFTHGDEIFVLVSLVTCATAQAAHPLQQQALFSGTGLAGAVASCSDDLTLGPGTPPAVCLISIIVREILSVPALTRIKHAYDIHPPPIAESCVGTQCATEYQYCPHGKPGATDSAYCCKKCDGVGKWVKTTIKPKNTCATNFDNSCTDMCVCTVKNVSNGWIMNLDNWIRLVLARLAQGLMDADPRVVCLQNL